MNNSGLEGLNGTIKSEGTFRERMGLLPFFNVLKRMLSAWSMDRDPQSPNFKAFNLSYPPVPDTKLYTDAYQFARDGRTISEVEIDESTVGYIMRAGCGSMFNDQELHSLLELVDPMQSSNWEEYFARKTKIRFIRRTDNAYECSCFQFKKYYSCKHALGLQVRMNLVEVPPQARNVPLGRKRKRGRPSRARRALHRQQH